MSMIKNVYFIQFSGHSNTLKFITVLRDGLYHLLTKEDLHAIAKCCGRRMEFVGPIDDNIFQDERKKFRVIDTKIDPYFESFIKNESLIKTWDGFKKFDIKTVSTLPKLNPTKVVNTVQLNNELKIYLRHITL